MHIYEKIVDIHWRLPNNNTKHTQAKVYSNSMYLRRELAFTFLSSPPPSRLFPTAESRTNLIYPSLPSPSLPTPLSPIPSASTVAQPKPPHLNQPPIYNNSLILLKVAAKVFPLLSPRPGDISARDLGRKGESKSREGTVERIKGGQ